MQMVLTCKDCTERTVGCHGRCEKYLKAKARQDLANRLRQKRDEKYPEHTTFSKEIHHGKSERVLRKH